MLHHPIKIARYKKDDTIFREDIPSTHDISSHYQWIVLCIILVVVVITRFLYLGQIYFWVDETPILGKNLWLDSGCGIRGFLKGMWKLSLDVYSYQTDNGTWAALVYVICKLFGIVSIWLTRLPAAIAGVLLPLVLFAMAQRITGSSIAGIFTAATAVMSVVQIHYAQQVVPYGPSVLAGALVLWSTIVWYDNLIEKPAKTHYLPCGFLFFISVTAAAMLHNCTLLLIAACFVVLAGSILLLWLRGSLKRNEAIYNLAILFQSGVVIILCVLIFVLPKIREGLRGYLTPYYAPENWNIPKQIITIFPDIISFAVKRGYDLATYALNPVYNDRWYQPLGLNPLCIVPVILVIVGLISLWLQSKKGKTFVVLALVSIILLILGALARLYPFGGIRQCLPFTVYIYLFVGAGTWLLYRKWKLISIGVFSLWFLLWLLALPQFYEKRLSPYNEEMLIHFSQIAKTKIFTTVNDYGNPEDSVFRYHLRYHPEIKVFPLWEVVENLMHEKKTFILASATKSFEKIKLLSHSGTGSKMKEHIALSQILSNQDIKVTPLTEIALNQMIPSEIQEKSQSIYTPLNGLFLYKMDWEDR